MSNPTSSGDWILVRADALPEIYGKVLRMKNELLENRGASVSETARRYGISRSAYYKYKDAVQRHVGRDTATHMTLRLLLQDSPGVLSGLLTAFAKAGANVLTVDQQAPADGYATVTISIQADRLSLPPDLFAERIGRVPGVQRILDIQQEGSSV